MNTIFQRFFTKRTAIAFGLTAAIIAAGAGWKLGGNEAVGRYLTAPVMLATIEDNVTALGTLQGAAGGAGYGRENVTQEEFFPRAR